MSAEENTEAFPPPGAREAIDAEAEAAELSPGGATSYPEIPIDLRFPTVQSKALNLIGEGKRVLELGCASGYMSKSMSERGCTVVGVEIDPEAAALAEPHCERVIVADLDSFDPAEELDGERFDAILATDLLEHLKDPGRLLSAVRETLEPGGHIVVTVPNVAHGSVRLALLNGRFPYGTRGLLDRTHLRFFTLETLDRLLEESGYAVVEVMRHQVPLEESSVSFESTDLTAPVERRLREDPEALTYQYVVRAFRLPAKDMEAVQQRVRESAELVGELRSELTQARYEITALRHRNENLEREFRAALYRLDRINRKLPFRAWYGFQKLPGLRRIWQRRQERFLAEVEAARAAEIEAARAEESDAV